MSSKFTWNFKNLKWVLFISVMLIIIMTVGNCSNKTQKYEIAGGTAAEEDEVFEASEGEEPEASTQKEPSAENIEIADEQKNIFVDIAGEVKMPSVVEIGEDERLQKAVEMAGGLTDGADRNAVNLAQKLVDGAQYIIPSKGEKLIVNYQEGSKPSGESAAGQDESGKININTASKEELMELNGIGEVISQRILDYRDENGKFESIENLRDVSGIGDKKFSDIKNDVCVE